MKYYELVTMKTEIFGAGNAALGIQAFLAESEAQGTLLGAWYSDVGQLNEVYLLRGFKGYDDLLTERNRVRLSSNPFNCSEFLLDLQMDSYIPLDFLPPVEVGEFGPLYEIRTYNTKLGELTSTIDKWREAIPARTAASLMTIAMYSIDGGSKFTQIWPYASANERAEIRARTVADGVWPPKDGPAGLTPDMRSTLAAPMSFSPLK